MQSRGIGSAASGVFLLALVVVLFAGNACAPRGTTTPLSEGEGRSLTMRFSNEGITADSAARVELGPNIYFVSATGPYRRFGSTLWLEAGTQRVTVDYMEVESYTTTWESEMPQTVQVEADPGRVYRIVDAVTEDAARGGRKWVWVPKLIDVTDEFRDRHFYFYVLDRRHPEGTIAIVGAGKGTKVSIFNMKGHVIKEWVTTDASCVWAGYDKRNRPVKPGLYKYRLRRADGSEEEGTIVVQEEGHMVVPDAPEPRQ